MIKVLLVDDHRVFTDVLRLGIEAEPGLRCIAVAHSLQEGRAHAASAEFDVAIVDLELPDCEGVSIVRSLLDLRPQARVLVLTAFARPDHARRALSAGAAGFLGKESALTTVFRAVRTATPTTPVVEPPLPALGPSNMDLTPREQDVLRQLGLGQEPYRIAANLGISLHTTRGHIKSLMRKLDARSQLGAVVAADRLGLLNLGRRY